jgi:uncharacterized RDD family membrane protein YckC
MKSITKGTRIINYLIDLLCISILSAIIIQISNTNVPIYFVVYLIYYFSFEAINGQTIGKRITNTKVVNMYNEKASVGRILYRTVLRLNPFDIWSYLFGHEQGAHDLLSKTRLISK